MSTVNPDSVAQDQLQSFVRRIEALEDEITALNGDKSEVYKEAKGNGFDTKVLRKVIADRRKDATERNEFDAVYQLYWDAIHGVVRAHVENIEEFDPETGEVLNETPMSHASVQPGREEPGTMDGAASTGETATVPVAKADDEAEAGAIGAFHDARADVATTAEVESVSRVGSGRTLPATSEDMDVTAGETAPAADDGLAGPAFAEDAQQANIKPAPNHISADRTKPNPWCADPDDCGVEASWTHMCGSCLRRRDAQRSAVEAMH